VKRRRIVLKLFLLLIVLLTAMAAVAWFFPGQILTVDSGPVKADAMVVLGGAGEDRVERAVELFKAGEAPRVICSGYGDDAANRRFLVKAGVPAKDVCLEGKSRNTRENAKFSVPLLRVLGARRVIIVTSWYHSRRALRCFEHYGPEIAFYSRPSYFGYFGETGGGTPSGSQSLSVTFQVRRQANLKQIRSYADSEYLKLLGYWACYGVCPF